MNEDDITAHNTVMLAKIVILSEKLIELEEKNIARGTHTKGDIVLIENINDLIHKYKQKIIRTDK